MNSLRKIQINRLSAYCFAALLFFLAAEIHAQLPGYSEQVTVTIDNTAGTSALSGYPILVSLNTQSMIAQGRLQADGDDIRFLDSDNTTPLSFWMVPETLNTPATRFWIRSFSKMWPGNVQMRK